MIYSILLVVGIYFVIGFGYVLLMNYYDKFRPFFTSENKYFRRIVLIAMIPIYFIIRFCFEFKDFLNDIKDCWNRPQY